MLRLTACSWCTGTRRPRSSRSPRRRRRRPRRRRRSLRSRTRMRRCMPTLFISLRCRTSPWADIKSSSCSRLADPAAYVRSICACASRTHGMRALAIAARCHCIARCRCKHGDRQMCCHGCIFGGFMGSNTLCDRRRTKTTTSRRCVGAIVTVATVRFCSSSQNNPAARLECSCCADGRYVSSGLSQHHGTRLCRGLPRQSTVLHARQRLRGSVSNGLEMNHS